MSKKIKREASLLMLVVAVLAFNIMPFASIVSTANAQLACTDCKQGRVPQVNAYCDDTTAQPAGLGWFDWDNGSGTGYCTAFQNRLNNKLIYDVCSCKDACTFAAGWVFGIELIILTKGVYWAADGSIPHQGVTNTYDTAANNTCNQGQYRLDFNRWTKGAVGDEHKNLCAANGSPAGRTFVSKVHSATSQFSVMYYDKNLNPVGPSKSTGAKILRTPTPYDGYELTQQDVDNNFCDWWIDMPKMEINHPKDPSYNPNVDAVDPADLAANAEIKVQVNLLTSAPLTSIVAGLCGAGSNVAGAPNAADLLRLQYLRDNDANGNAALVSDPYYTGVVFPPSPQFACDFVANNNVPTLYYEGIGSTTQVWNGVTYAGCQWKWTSKFCPSCTTPCNCVRTVGTLCCAGGYYCLYFPYVLHGQQDASGNGWLTGVGLSALTKLPAAPSVKAIITDCNGTSYTATLPMTYCLNNGGMSIDQLLSDNDIVWTPSIADITAGQSVLWIESNYQLDGYQFNYFKQGDMLFGAGVQPRFCYYDTTSSQRVPRKDCCGGPDR